MADTFTFVIRFLHILSGVSLVGGAFIWSMVVMPTVSRRLPPPLRGPFIKEAMPRVSRYLSIAGILAIVTGFWMMGLIVGFGEIVPAFKGTTWGIALGAGLAAALGMLVIAWTVIMPSANKLLALAAKAPPPAVAVAAGGVQTTGAAAQATAPVPPPEVAALQKRLAIASLTNVALGALALGAMAFAVNARF